jgi:hypothetical protein
MANPPIKVMLPCISIIALGEKGMRYITSSIVTESMKNPNSSRKPIAATEVPILFLCEGSFRDNATATKRITNGKMDVTNSDETREMDG